MTSVTLDCERDRPGTITDFRCPACGRAILCTARGLPEHPNCPDCEALLWCRTRIESDLILLTVFPDAQPEIHDMSTVGQSLPLSRKVRGLILNLRGVDTVNSSFLAGLMVLHRLVKDVGGKLALCEVHPHIRSILQRLNLHTLMSICNSEQDALNVV